MVAESTRATFTRMQDGTADDYAKIDHADAEYFAALPTRILAAVAALATDGLSAYTIDRTSHSLQSATRALRAGEEEDYVVAALIHDVGDPLAPFSHGRLAASIIKPFVSPRIAWIVERRHDASASAAETGTALAACAARPTPAAGARRTYTGATGSASIPAITARTLSGISSVSVIIAS